MKLAFISTMHDWQWGGSEELWSQAAAQLKKEGHSVLASVGYWPQLSGKITVLANVGVRVETHPSGKATITRRILNKILLRRKRSYRSLKKFAPDLAVISQGHNAGGFEWARVCRAAAIPYVMIVHCNAELWWFQEAEMNEAIATYTGARNVFCVSRTNLDLLQMQLGRTLPNAEIVWNPYNVLTDAPPAWPDASGTMRLACVARIDPAAKGHDLLLKTLALPEWRDRPIELHCFGTGPFEGSMRRMAAMLELKNVFFRGHVSAVRTIWEQCHLLILASRYEGLPLALVEAMWCGRPAIVTDVGGNAELCIDGETGFVASSATVSSLCEALHRAWEHRNDWEKMGAAARTHAEQLIPTNSTALFCERLKVCVGKPKAPAQRQTDV